MGTVIKSQKTELYWASGPAAVTRATSITNINGLASPREAIENTDLDATTDKTYFAGLGAPGPVTVAVNVRKGELAHRALIDLRDSGAVVSWGIYSSGADTVPTAVGGVLQAASGRVSARFMGFVSDVSVDVQGNSIWKGTITIQRSGKVSYDLQTPDEEIAAMFAAGEQGAWYDPSDWSTLFQDFAGTTPVTALEQPVGRMLDKSGRGNHMGQGTAGSRPVLSARVNLLLSTDAILTSWGPWTGGNRTVANDGPYGWPATTVLGPPSDTALSNVQQFTAPSEVVSLGVYVKAQGADTALKPFLLRNSTTATNFTIGSWNPATGAVFGAGWTSTAVGDGWYFLQYTQATGIAVGNQLTAYLGSTGSLVGASYAVKLSSPMAVAGASLGRYQRVTNAADYDSAGFPQFLRFDGVDDSLQTGLFDFTGTNKVTLVAGVRKNTDASVACLVELSNSSNTSPGSFGVLAPETAGVNEYRFRAFVSSLCRRAATPFAAPTTSVISCGFDNAGAGIAAQVMPRINGVTPALSDTGVPVGAVGNFGNYPFYLGRRSGSSLPFSGNVYSLCLLGRLATATEMAALEARAALRAGVTL